MKKSQDKPADAAELRRRAEKRLKESKKEEVRPGTKGELQRLLHELQAHQIELEMQNEELLKARAEVEAGLERYTDLYDFAPVGYLMLDHDGTIRQVNLTGARLLGVERSQLVNRRFGLFVSEEDRPAFNAFLKKVFESQAKESCEVALLKEGNHPFYVYIEAVVTKDGQECHAAVADIAERKRAEEVLKESEKRYRQVVENAAEIIYSIDLKGNFTYGNPAGLEVTGFSLEELRKLNYADLVAPEHRERVAEIYASQFRQRIPTTHVEFPFFNKTGGITWFSQNTSLIIEDGRVIGFHIIARDITERKKAEEALKKSEEKYRVLVENANEAIFVIQDGMLRFFNIKNIELIGYSKEELTSAPYINFVHPDDRQTVFERYLKRIKGEKLPGVNVFRIVDKAGNIRWVEVNSVLISWEGRPATLNFLNDITERKRAEEALKASEERFRELYNNAPVGYHEYDIEGRITRVNRTELEMLGYTFEERIGQFVWSSITEEDKSRQTVLDKLAGVIPASRGLERTYRRKDGTTFPVLIQDQLLRDKNGRIAGNRSTIQDITERKQAEEALATSEERYHSLFDLVPIGLYRTTPEGKMLELNPALIEMLGYPDRESLVGERVADTYADPEARAEWKRLVERDGLVLNFQKQLRRYDGSVIWVLENTRVVRDQDGEILYYQGSFQDITDRMRAEEGLFESEQRYRNLVENAPDVIFTLAPDGTIASLSPAFETITGWPRSEWLQRQFISIVHPDDLSAGLEFFQRILKEGKLPPFQLRVLKKSGDYLVAEFTVTPQTQHGFVVGILGIARDITERKQTEELLRSSEEKYRTILENIQEGYLEVDLTGNFTFVNDAECRNLGYAMEELIGMNYRQYTDETTAKKLYQTFNGVYRTGDPVNILDTEIIKKGGTKAVNELSVSLIKDSEGIPIGFRGIARDITERKRAEESLKQSEENARQLAQENAMMAEIGRIISSTLDIDEIYESFSSEVKKIIPFDRVVIDIINTEKNTVRNVYMSGEKLQDRNVKDIYPLEGSGNAEMVRTKSIFLIQTEDFSEYKKRFPMLLSTFQAGFRSIMNVPLFSKGKVIGGLLLRSLKPYAYTEKDVKLAERIASQIAGAVANAQLYAERIHAEKEKEALQEQLRQSQKMEAIGRLAGGIAHDFNNLLTIIKGYSQLSLLELKESDPVRENMEEVRKASDRASDLIRQLLAFSRRQILDMMVLDLNMVMGDLDKMLRRVIGEDIELVTLLAEDLGRVKADPGQMQQVIMNLAVNAKDAMPNGGKLTIETADVELDETYARSHVAVIPGRYAMLSVSDTGVGMTAEVKEQVFEPFFTTKEKGKGTGLGLATVYGIVKQSGGNIWLYSEPGQGTTFKIYLPRVDEPLEELKEKAEVKEIPRGSETILVVEDEKEVLKLTSRILKGQGYRILEAATGEEALMICKANKEPFDLLLTDVVMPQMSGRQLKDQLERACENFKVLYMSGYTDNAIVHHGVLERGVNYIQKPFTLEGLARKVREVLDK